MYSSDYPDSKDDCSGVVTTDSNVSAVGMVATKGDSPERDRCQCDAAGFCSVRDCRVNILLWKKCQSGHGRQVDTLLFGAKNAKPLPQASVVTTLPDVSTFGTQLRTHFESAMAYTISCGTCLTLLRSLNQTTVYDREHIVDSLLAGMNMPQWIRDTCPTLALRREWIETIFDIEYAKLKASEMETLEKERQLLAAHLSTQKKRIVCGEIDDALSKSFLARIRELVPGVELGSVASTSRRRIVATGGYERQVQVFVERFNAEQTEVKTKTIEWVYGLTTVPSRIDLLPHTLASLCAAGFGSPTLFVDAEPSTLYESFGLPVIFRGTNARTYLHWLLSVIELYGRNPEADRYIMFQDDLVACVNLRGYLESCEFPVKGYWNLFSFMDKNEAILSKSKQGWVESDQRGKGGLGLVFDNACLMDLLSQFTVYDRIKDPVRGHKFLDGAVVDAMNRAGRKEMIHNPSLLQHTGTISSMGNGNKESGWGNSASHPSALTFPGQSFDALQWVAPPCET